MEKSFDTISYNNIAINDLILFSILSVIESREECSFERLVKECFMLFPQVFSFSRYPQWPDSRKLDRPLRDLRNKKLVIGDPKTLFSLTNAGKRAAAEISKNFWQRKLFK